MNLPKAQDNTIDTELLLCSLALVIRGTTDERLNGLFQLINNGDTTVSKENVCRLIGKINYVVLCIL